MNNLKYYWSKLKYRLTHLRGAMDYLLVAITAFNGYSMIMSLMSGHISGFIISGLFFAFCLMGLLN